MSYPTSIDSIPQPTATSPSNNPSNAGVAVAQTNAIVALETKLGTGASTPVASTLLRGTGTGTSAFAQANLTTDVTGTLPVLNGGTGVTTSTGSGNTVLSTSPALTTPTGIVKNDVGLGNVDNTSDATKNAASVTLTNKTIDASLNTFSNIPYSAIASTAWQTWSPTFVNWTIGTGGSAGTTARYVEIGKLIRFYIFTRLGTSGQSVGGGVTFTIPQSINTSSIVQAYGSIVMSLGGINYSGVVAGASSTTASVQVQLANGTYTTPTSIGSTVPATWAAGDYFSASGTYEAA